MFLLFVLGVYALVGGPGVVPSQLRAPAVGTLLYVANWQQLAAGHSYFAPFEAVNPLMHTWSLAVEEQYYLVWPLLFVGLWFLGRRRSLRALVIGASVLSVGSALWMGFAAHLVGPDRAYLGTDTRIWELLLGGLGRHGAAPGRPRPPSGPLERGHGAGRRRRRAGRRPWVEGPPVGCGTGVSWPLRPAPSS